MPENSHTERPNSSTDSLADTITFMVRFDRPSSEQLAHYSRGEKAQILTEASENARAQLVDWLTEQGLEEHVTHIGESNAFSTLFIDGSPSLANSLRNAPGVVEVSATGDFPVDLLIQPAEPLNGDIRSSNHRWPDAALSEQIVREKMVGEGTIGEKMTPIVGLAEIVLWTSNQQASLRFYRDILQLQVISPPELPNVFLKVGDGRAGIPQMLVLVPMPEDIKAQPSGNQLHHLAFELPPESFDSQMRLLQEAGYSPRGGKHPILASRTMYVDDPDGNEVEFICAED